MQRRGERRWLINAKPCPRAAFRLFCLPYAGGTASAFRDWSGILPAEIELWAVELPGRGTRRGEPAASRISALVPPLADAFRAAIDRPFAVFGHSMGAILGFEVVRELQASHGLKAARLFASGHRAPQLPDREPPTHDLPEAELIARLRELSGTPREILDDSDTMQLLLPCLRRDFEAAETYVPLPGPRLVCPISAYGGLADTTVEPEELDAWREQTSGAFSRRMFPGGHFFVHSATAHVVAAVARELLAYR